jgi:DAK2 domain fusion protein YloV
MTRLSCDGPTLMRSVAAAVANLERHVGEVDSINVFPVPDGDTGSNMLATIRAALAEAERLPSKGRDLGPVADALGRGAIRGARGNSGVILAQIIRGMTAVIDGRRRATGIDLAAGLRRGTQAAYGSVLAPVEGTILTVIRDAAEAAETEATRHRDIERVLAAAVDAAARSVERTPMLLPVLADAGVVDSGGEGLLRILEGTMQIDAGDGPTDRAQASDAIRPNGPRGSAAATAPVADGYVYETVYLVESSAGDLDLDLLRRELGAVSESIVVAGDARAARVHVHGPRPDLALAIGRRLGRVSDVAVTDLDAAAAEALHDRSDAPVPGSSAPAMPLALVALVDGEGIEPLLTSLGVARVVRAAAKVAETVAAIGAEHVLLLTTSDLAASDLASGGPVTPVRTRNVGEMVAAALAFDPSAPPDANAERMARDAARLRTVAIRSVAVGFAALGADGERLASVSDLAGTVVAGIAAVRREDFELATLYAGAAPDDTATATAREAILAAWPGVEVDVVAAGHPDDALLVALD